MKGFQDNRPFPRAIFAAGALVAAVAALAAMKAQAQSGGVYTEDFSNGQPLGWIAYDPADWQVSNDRYRAERPDATGRMSAIFGQATWDNTIMQADVQTYRDSAAGIVISASSNFDGSNGSAYMFVVRHITTGIVDGEFAVFKVVNGTRSTLKAFTDSPTIKRSGINILRVEQSGNNLKFFINDNPDTTTDDDVQMVWEGSDAGLGPGYIGLYGETQADKSSTHYFDNVIVSGDATPPSNDDFSNAAVISDLNGQTAGWSIGATLEDQEPAHGGTLGGASVWFVWQAPIAGLVTFKTDGTLFDNVLAVYKGTGFADLVKVAVAGGGGSSKTNRVSIHVKRGDIYFIAMDGIRGAVGYYQLSWDMELSRLRNISTRGYVGSGENVLISGFIVAGLGPKQVLVTGYGPSLGPLGVPFVLLNPELSVFQDQTELGSNDDWVNSPDAATIAGLGLAPSNNLESAVLLTLDPGQYTAVLSGVNKGTGNGLVAAWDITEGKVLLSNISTRGSVGTGDNVMIAGFIVKGPQPKAVGITGWGPSLSSQGINKPLPDPALAIYAGSTQIAFNDDWGNPPYVDRVVAAGIQPPDAKESAIVLDLQPGEYTAILSGTGDATGIGLVAVWDLD